MVSSNAGVSCQKGGAVLSCSFSFTRISLSCDLEVRS